MSRHNPGQTDKMTAVPLTPEAFQGFGAVLMARGPRPQRDEFAAHMENRRHGAKANLTYLQVPPRPAIIGAVERHTFSSQTFVPMNGARCLIAVCPSAADGGQAVHYDAGTWHGPLCPLAAPGEFVMLRWDDGSDDDTELHPLDRPITVAIG